MDFPPIDETTALAINEVIDRCENALIDQLERTLAAFDDAINHISDARFRTMLADRRSVVAAQVPPLEAVGRKGLSIS